MKKEDFNAENRVGDSNIRPISYFRFSGLFFTQSYFDYKCKVSYTLANGFSTEKFGIMNCDKTLIKQLMKKRYNINDTK